MNDELIGKIDQLIDAMNAQVKANTENTALLITIIQAMADEDIADGDYAEPPTL